MYQTCRKIVNKQEFRIGTNISAKLSELAVLQNFKIQYLQIWFHRAPFSPNQFRRDISPNGNFTECRIFFPELFTSPKSTLPNSHFAVAILPRPGCTLETWSELHWWILYIIEMQRFILRIYLTQIEMPFCRNPRDILPRYHFAGGRLEKNFFLINVVYMYYYY